MKGIIEGVVLILLFFVSDFCWADLSCSLPTAAGLVMPATINSGQLTARYQ